MVLSLTIFMLGCKKSNEPTPQNQTTKNAFEKKNSNIAIFQELKLATESYMSVIEAKYASIKNNQVSVQSLIQELNAYSQTTPEKIDLASVATTLGFEDEETYKSSITRIQNATLAIKQTRPNLSNTELLDIIKDELGWNPEDNQQNPDDNQQS